MKIIYLITILLITKNSISLCGQGCLQCNRQNNCLLCDYKTNYYLNITSCVLSTKPNCLVLSQIGVCAQCSPSYFYDSNAANCVAVSYQKTVANCVAYDINQSCTQCSGNFFAAYSLCYAVSNPITNCLAYIGDNNCAYCMSGFLLSNDSLSCVSNSDPSNCLFYNYYSCSTCNTGFIINKNFYFNRLTDPTFVFSLLSVNSQNSGPLISVSQTCQATTVLNCAVFTTFNTCQTCNSNYYPAYGLCFQFPAPQIAGCALYSSLTNCVACINGMFLNANNCTIVLPIVNCNIYNGASTVEKF